MSLSLAGNQTRKRKCEDCGKEYTSRQHLWRRHWTEQHPEEVKKKQQESSHSRCLEEGCGFAATSISNLRDHLEAVHQMSFTVVQKTFSSRWTHDSGLMVSPRWTHVDAPWVHCGLTMSPPWTRGLATTGRVNKLCFSRWRFGRFGCSNSYVRIPVVFTYVCLV